MVKGLDVFQAWFAEHADQYVLIGGTAASLTMDEAGLVFRATKDLDVVLHVEVLTPAFGVAFWKFVEAGGYEIIRWLRNGLNGPECSPGGRGAPASPTRGEKLCKRVWVTERAIHPGGLKASQLVVLCDDGGVRLSGPDRAARRQRVVDRTACGPRVRPACRSASRYRETAATAERRAATLNIACSPRRVRAAPRAAD